MKLFEESKKLIEIYDPDPETKAAVKRQSDLAQKWYDQDRASDWGTGGYGDREPKEWDEPERSPLRAGPYDKHLHGMEIGGNAWRQAYPRTAAKQDTETRQFLVKQKTFGTHEYWTTNKPPVEMDYHNYNTHFTKQPKMGNGQGIEQVKSLLKQGHRVFVERGGTNSLEILHHDPVTNKFAVRYHEPGWTSRDGSGTTHLNQDPETLTGWTDGSQSNVHIYTPPRKR